MKTILALFLLLSAPALAAEVASTSDAGRRVSLTDTACLDGEGHIAALYDGGRVLYGCWTVYFSDEEVIVNYHDGTFATYPIGLVRLVVERRK